MLPVSPRHSKIRRKAFCFLLCCSLIFPVIAVAGSVPAAALTYELGSPSLFEYPDAGYYGFSFFASSTSGNVVTYDLDDLLTGLGFWYNPGRVPLVNNIPSDIAISYHLDSYFDNVYLVEDSSYTGEDSILFTDYEMIGKIDPYVNCALSAFRFIYPKISFTQSMADKVFKLNYSFDYYDRFAEDDSSYLALKSLFNELVSPALLVTGSPEVPPFVAPASSVVVTKTAVRSFNLTAYFDFSIGDLFSSLGTGSYTDFQPIVTLPNIFTWSTLARSFRIKQHVHFPTEYDLIAGGAYGAEIEAINEQLSDIQVTISNQSTVIISGVQDALEDTLINNRDPENDEKISEMESKQVEVSEVMSDYDRFHSRIKQAAQSELSVPDYLGLDPEGGFADMIGQIVSLPLFLGIIPVGLFFGLLKILFGTGG